MYKNKKFIWMLTILLMLVPILSFKLVFVKNKFIIYKNQVIHSIKNEKSVTVNKNENIERYGYSEILECIRKNKDFEVKSINMMENEKCNVEIYYKGDTKLLYSSLFSLSKSKNFLNIDKINISKDTKITSLNINFKKNK